MHILPIYVYGAGSVFAEFFNALSAAVGTGTFTTLLRISALLAGTTALASAIFRRDFLLCVKWFATFYLVFYIIFWPKVAVEIIDRTDSRHYAVDNIPLGLGILASVTTSIGDSLTKLTEEIFTMPDDLGYSKTGMVMASKLALASRQFQITDSRLNENMERFMVQCVHWPIMLGHYSMDDLVTADNLWGFISEHAPKSRSFLYDRTITVCKDGVHQLGKDLQENLDQVAIRGGAKLFSGSKTPAEAKGQLLKYLPLAYGYLLKTSGTATNILQQSVMANAITNSLLYFGISTNSQTAVTNYAATRAQEQQRLTQNTLGFLAGYWLPIMKSAFEAIMYGCFLFVLLLSLFPFGLSVLKNYVYTLCWLQTWAPLYAIVNLICSYYAKVESLATPEQSGFILKNWYSFLQVNHDMASLAGYLTLSVPFVAAGLVKGMAGTMTHVAQYMGGVSQSVGSQAAAEAVAGNISMGVTGMRNNSAFNMSAHQQDLTARMSSGASYQLPGGESINFMPDGGVAVNRGNTISDLGVNVNLAKSIQSTAMQQSDYAYSAAKGEAVAAGENYQAGMRSLYELSEHAGNSKSSGDAWIVSENTSAVQALNKTRDLTQQFADEHQISYDHAKEVLTAAHDRFTGSLSAGGSLGTPDKAGISVGTVGNAADTSAPTGVGTSVKTSGVFSAKVGLDVGLSGGVDWTTQHKDSDAERRILSDAENFAKKSGYSENVDMVSRAAIDHSFHSNNEKGARLLDSMGSSFDKSNSLRKDADAHFQQAASYRNVASHAEENAVQTNVNAGQAFLDYIANQPGPNGHGRMGVMTAVSALRDPENAKLFAEHFARDYANRNLSSLGQGVPHSQQEIRQIHQNNAESISTQANVDLQKHQTVNKGQVMTSAGQRELLNESLVDASVKGLAESKFEANKQVLQQHKDQLDNAELAKEQKFSAAETQEKQARDNGILHDATFTSRKETRKNISDKLDKK